MAEEWHHLNSNHHSCHSCYSHSCSEAYMSCIASYMLRPLAATMHHVAVHVYQQSG